MSPGVERDGGVCDDLGERVQIGRTRGAEEPSQASEPKPTTQDNIADDRRKPTARTSPLMSAQIARAASRLLSPRFSVTTRKIACRVAGSVTGWVITRMSSTRQSC